jgi:type VI secretion system protein
MQPYTLFDILTENCDSNISSKDLSALFHSIQTHLALLLNTRRGSLQHLPLYGLPDLGEIYQSLPYSINYFTRTLTETIQLYEPRLKQTVVRYQPQYHLDCIIHFEIAAQLQQSEKVQFNTHFMTGGIVNIEKK